MFDPEYFRWPVISEETIAFISGKLREGKTSLDPEMFAVFEKALCEYFDVRHALLTCNGTSAGFSAFYALGLKEGDEVIAPPYAHWATTLQASLLGCRIVFADLEPDSLSLSPGAIEAAITPATRAVVVCHLYGNPVDIVAISRICDHHGLHLVEDISHAPGASVDGRRVGSFGRVAFTSFQGKKMISGGEGGALLTSDEDLYCRATELGHPKRISQLPARWRTCDRVGRGYKFRLNAISGWLAYRSFRELPETLAVRERMCREFRRRVADIAALSFAHEAPGSARTFLANEMLLTDDRRHPQEVVGLLLKNRINARTAMYEFLPDLPSFKQSGIVTRPLENARRHYGALFQIDAFIRESGEILDRYSDVFHEVFAR
jgi:perosamine synthetase